MIQRRAAVRFRGEPGSRDATVEEIWLARQVATHVSLTALLSSAQPECPVGRITRRRRWPPEQIITYLETVLEFKEGCRALVYDGRAGYTIFPRGFDDATGGLIYTDPWPGDSVLCAQQNHAGTRAIRYARGNWLLSRTDFARVLFAALIATHVFDALGDFEPWPEKTPRRTATSRSARKPSRRKPS